MPIKEGKNPYKQTNWSPNYFCGFRHKFGLCENTKTNIDDEIDGVQRLKYTRTFKESFGSEGFKKSRIVCDNKWSKKGKEYNTNVCTSTSIMNIYTSKK